MSIVRASHITDTDRAQFGWFGMNKHHEQPKVEEIYSEITGRKVGRTIEHWDGKQDAGIKNSVVEATAEESERITGLPLNDFRHLIYDYHRDRGMGHDEAVALLFRDGKIKV